MHTVPAGRPRIFSVSPSLIVTVAVPAVKLTLSAAVLPVRSAAKVPFSPTLFFAAVTVTVNVTVLSPSCTVLLMDRSPSCSVFSKPPAVVAVV